VSLWLADSKLIDNEDLSLEIIYTTVDSAGNFITARDTASFVSRTAGTPVARRSGEPVEVVLPSEAVSSSKLSMVSNVEGGRQLDLNVPVRLQAKRPVASVIDSLFVLEELKDTLKLARDFTITADTFSRVLNVHSRWQSVARYSLTILPGAVTDIYGVVNDTLELQFRTRNIEEYGNIVINAQSDSFPLIVQ
jgi:hypothetical protein